MLPVPVHLVLIAPQDIVNVASCVRICRNFGMHGLRVVQPEIELDAYRIEGIAHNTADFIARIQVFETLDEAIADCVTAMVLTGRERTAKRRVLRPRAAAEELLARAMSGPVALVAGREDKGISNEELDRCQTLITISTDPTYTSLNLAQSVAVMCYELWTTAGGDDIPFKTPRRESPPSTQADLEHVFRDWEVALSAIEFFKTRQRDNVMRSLRETFFRAVPDQREAKLLRAVGIEIRKYMERKGIMVGSGERAAGSEDLGRQEGQA